MNSVNHSGMNFFTLMIDKIKENTKDGITNVLEASFSTTQRIEKLLSVAVVMNSFQKYFDYGRCIPGCGIRNVLFMGTLEDWNKLADRLVELIKYDVDGAWKKYVEEVAPIIKKFINTYNGKVDVSFWNKIMNFEHGRLGSGSTTKVSGWILKFFGIYNQVDTSDINSYNIDFPVEIDNHLTGIKKMVNIVGGFGGVYKDNENLAYRPQMSMIVLHDGTNL